MPEELFSILVPRDVSPGFLMIDDVPHPRRQVAGRDRQQLGRTDVLVQHDVSGKRLYHSNKVERRSRT